MNLKFLLFLVTLCLSLTVTAQEIVVRDADLQGNQTYNWTADNVYILDGLVYLEEGGVLNIEAGTVIKGINNDEISGADETSALIITRGAQIFARGTADQPIIFTAQDDDISDPDDFTAADRGEWGGLILLGRATIARPGGEDGIEGIVSSEPRARFGGTDDADNSGVLRYVSIRHGGAQLSTDNEINGLTLGGVGSGTEIDYIEVFANQDDGIEWFGGTVGVKHASVAFCGDDGFDYDYGWRGKGQFWFALQEPGTSTGRAGEHDGAKPDNQAPFSQPTIYNVTYVGIGSDGMATGGDALDNTPTAVLFRDNAGGFYRNSLFTGFNGHAIGVEIQDGEDTDAFDRLQAGDLALTNNLFEDFGETDLFVAVAPSEDVIPGQPSADVAALLNADNEVGASGIASISRTPNGMLDPRIDAGGAALSGGEVNTDDEFFNVATYRGAFGNRVNWLAGWTALSDNGYLGNVVEPINTNDCIVITDADLEGGQTYNWGGGNCYTLDGLVYLEADGVLNIAEGTVIRGLNGDDVSTDDNTSGLIITRGAQIFARGTATQPIVFTAAEDDLTDPEDFTSVDRGEWGGLIILGNATIARPGGEDGIEGITSSEARARFGGTDDADNSGVLRYVSIRHGGAQLSTDNEINGLTLGGVGSGTEIDYVEVFANSDDGIEFFGGTVSVDHAAVSFCGDDSFDYDYGWRGRGQFWYSLQGPGTSTGRAGEHDGAKPDNLAPFSNPTICNATYVGIGADQTATGGDAAREERAYAVLFRDNAAGTYANSIFTDFNRRAIAVEDIPGDDTDSYARLLAGDLTLTNNAFWNFGNGTTPADLFYAVNPGEEIVPASSAVVVTTLTAAGNVIADPDLIDEDRDANGGNIDPRPNPLNSLTAGAVAIDGCANVEYLGAFVPGGNRGQEDPSWLNDWTALTTSGIVLDAVTGVGEVERNGFLLDAPVPNPAYDRAAINFTLPRAADLTLTVLDITGRPVVRLRNSYAAGPQTAVIDVTQLANGTYIVLLDAAGSRLVQKLIVNK